MPLELSHVGQVALYLAKDRVPTWDPKALTIFLSMIKKLKIKMVSNGSKNLRYRCLEVISGCICFLPSRMNSTFEFFLLLKSFKKGGYDLPK